MDSEVGVLGVGHAIAGNLRGPMTSRKLSGAHINLRKADSCGAVAVLYIGGPPCLAGLSMTDLSPGGRRTSAFGRKLQGGIVMCGTHNLLVQGISFQSWCGPVRHHVKDVEARLAT